MTGSHPIPTKKGTIMKKPYKDICLILLATEFNIGLVLLLFTFFEIINSSIATLIMLAYFIITEVFSAFIMIYSVICNRKIFHDAYYDEKTSNIFVLLGLKVAASFPIYILFYLALNFAI